MSQDSTNTLGFTVSSETPETAKYLAPKDAPYTHAFTPDKDEALCKVDPTGRAHIAYWQTLKNSAASEGLVMSAEILVTDAEETLPQNHPLFRTAEHLTGDAVMLCAIEAAAVTIRCKLREARVMNLTPANTTTPYPVPTVADDEETAAARLRHSEAAWSGDSLKFGKSKFVYAVGMPLSPNSLEPDGLIYFRTYTPYTPSDWADAFFRLAGVRRKPSWDARDCYSDRETAGKFDEFLDERTGQREHWEWCLTRFVHRANCLDLGGSLFLNSV